MKLGKNQNCESICIFMELGKKVRFVKYELRILRIFEYLWNWVKKSELWDMNSAFWEKSQNSESFLIFMELGKKSELWEFFLYLWNWVKKRIVRIFEYLWNWVKKSELWEMNSKFREKSQNCENFWIFMELGEKVRIVRIFEYLWNWVKKSELWELNSEFWFYGGVYFIFAHI